MTQRFEDALKPRLSGPTRRRIVRGRLATRRLTSRLRVLPDFLVIGGMRCGTSSLYKYLGYHPSVAPSLRKETEFLTTARDQGEDWYRAHFPLAVRRTATSLLGRQLLTFEASPDYIFAPHVAERAARLLPGAKAIALVREPAARAISHYRHVARHGWETLDLAEALDREDERTSEDRERMERDPGYWGPDYMAFSYVARGMYADQLSRWLAHYPREQILVMPSEQMYDDPRGFYDQVLDFLELPSYTPRFVNYSTRPPRPETPADPAVLARLAATFREPNERLFELLGRDLGWNDPA